MVKYLIAIAAVAISFFATEYFVLFKNPYEYLNTTAVLLIVNFFIFISVIIAIAFTFVMEKNIDRYRRRLSRTLDNLPTLEEFIATTNSLRVKTVKRNFAAFAVLLKLKEGRLYEDASGNQYSLLSFDVHNRRHEITYIGRQSKEIDLLIDEPYPTFKLLDSNNERVIYTLDEFVKNLHPVNED